MWQGERTPPYVLYFVQFYFADVSARERSTDRPTSKCCHPEGLPDTAGGCSSGVSGDTLAVCWKGERRLGPQVPRLQRGLALPACELHFLHLAHCLLGLASPGDKGVLLITGLYGASAPDQR